MCTKRFSAVGEGLQRAKTALSHFAPFLAPRKKGLLLALVLLLLETGTSLAQPWPLALILDYVIGAERLSVPVNEQVLLVGIAALLVFVTTASRGVAATRRY